MHRHIMDPPLDAIPQSTNIGCVDVLDDVGLALQCLCHVIAMSMTLNDVMVRRL